MFLLAASLFAPAFSATETAKKEGQRTLEQLVDGTLLEGKKKKLARGISIGLGLPDEVNARAVVYRVADLPKGKDRGFYVLTEDDGEGNPRVTGLVWANATVELKDEKKIYDAWYYRSDLTGKLKAVLRWTGGKEKFEQHKTRIDKKARGAFEKEKEFFLGEAATMSPLP